MMINVYKMLILDNSTHKRPTVRCVNLYYISLIIKHCTLREMCVTLSQEQRVRLFLVTLKDNYVIAGAI